MKPKNNTNTSNTSNTSNTTPNRQSSPGVFQPLNIIAVADTDEKRIMGLRALGGQLPPDAGMLFVFPELTDSSFWNQGVNYPIDIGFFDEHGKLLFTTSMGPNQSQPVFCIMGHYKYALEAPYKWFEKFKIPAGTPLNYLININKENDNANITK